MFSSVTNLFMREYGTGAPAIIPVLRREQSKFTGRGTEKMDSNMVGTPWTAVHFSVDIASRTAAGSNVSFG